MKPEDRFIWKPGDIEILTEEANVSGPKGELKDWERFALNRVGRKSGRRFEVKTLTSYQADGIERKLASCSSPEAIKALFGAEAAKVAYWEGFVRDTEAFEPKVINALRNMFRSQLKEAVDKLKKAKGPGDVTLSREKAIRDYSAAIAAVQGEAMLKGSRDAQLQIKPANPHAAVKQDFPRALSEAALKWLNTRIQWAAQQVTDETEKALRAQLSIGFEKGESMFDIAERIRDVFNEADQVRAERIARTEVIAAASQGAVDSYKEAGLTESEWYPAMDERLCPLCESLAGVHALEEQYTPPAHPNCRCVLLPVLEGENG